MSLLKDLKQACLEEAFSLVYQPQWAVREQQWIGAEVLIRWQHPARGLVPPDEFIPLAENEGLISVITEYVVKQSLYELGEAGIDKLQLSTLTINLSHLVLMDKQTMDNLFAIIESTRFEYPRVVWEITETAAMENIDATLGIMQNSRYQNMDFSIDDFGTGYSSLSRLKRLPLSELKIDRSFIDDIPHDENDAVIVKTILAMAKTLCLNVVAEGVETKEQADFLKNNGCAVIQGYLYARPMAIDDLKQQLQKRPVE
ncbi:MAG TPA: EAL domain-containing protein [Cellvibrionaceae bacterium]